MLTKEEILEKARSQAKKFIIKKDGKVDKSESLTTSQLRRFFDEVKRLKRKYDTLCLEKGKDEAYREISHMLAMVAVNANYTFSRGKIPEEFLKFLENEIKKVNSAEKFEEFVKYFEAVTGYYYYEAKQAKLRID